MLSAKKAAAVATAASSHPDLVNKPGVFMMISPQELRVDTHYQRPVSGARTDKIASNWSWIDCGCLTVALRGPGSGEYFVIDGQHRLEGAIRANISELPCIVFESISTSDEAETFVSVNTNRKSITVVDRYRAMLAYEDPIALQVQTWLTQANREAATGGVHTYASRARSIMCLDFLLHAAQRYPETLDKLWPLMIELCDEQLITKRLLQGFCYIERFLTNTSVTESHWRRRILRVGYDAITKSIDETAKFEKNYTTAVCARGVLRAVNHGLQNRLHLTISEKAPETGES